MSVRRSREPRREREAAAGVATAQVDSGHVVGKPPDPDD